MPDAILPADPLDALPPGTRIAVAMSGGVDSSVAALRCVERGFDVVGITLAMWARDREVERDRGCCSVDAVEDARRVADLLGIAHYTWNLEQEFGATVIRDFEEEYAQGRTPNPCVRCNVDIKFGTLLERAGGLGIDHVATGHYARTGRRGDAITLHRARDTAKDQSYTLHGLDQRQLRAAVFPLGEMNAKADVRALAERHGLVNASKPDSQELCFVDVSVRDELTRRLQGRFAPGDIRDEAGRVVGRHRGIPFYTVGQRAGLGLRPATPDAAPQYVVRIDAAANEIVVGTRAAALTRDVVIGSPVWCSEPATAGAGDVAVQLRAHGPVHPVRIVACTAGELAVELETPGAVVAPGQSAVLYRGDEVLGGGRVAVPGRVAAL